MVWTISKSKLKTHMLEVFRELEATGQELIVTDRDKPVLRIVPIVEKRSVAELFGQYQGKLEYDGDINAPTLDEWAEA